MAGCGSGDDSSADRRRRESPALAPAKPKVTVPEGAAADAAGNQGPGRRQRRRSERGDEVTVQYVGVDYEERQAIRLLLERQRTVQLHARRRRSDPRLGPGRRRDEGRRSSRADHPARTRLRRRRRLHRRSSPNETLVFVIDLLEVSYAPSQILAERLTAQGLSGPPLADPVAVAERLLAVQGQDPRGFRLAVRARTEGLDRGRRRAGLGGARTDRHLAQPRHAAPGSQRGLPAAAGSDHAAAASPPASAGYARRA